MTPSTLQQQQDSSQQKISRALALLNQGGKRTVREMRTLIMGLEAAMQAMPECSRGEEFTSHHFESGVYMRELFIPKGSVLTGRIHKTSHLNILSQGKLTVWTEDGMRTLTASTVIQSKPGIKRVGYAHEDSVWITVHQNPSNEKEISKVEARLFAWTFDEAYLSSQRSFEDVIDFLGFSREEMQAISENPFDQVDVNCPRVFIAPSLVHGNGVFAKETIQKGEVIAQARIQNKRTQVGRYCNHHSTPNAQMVMGENGDVDLISLTQIDPDKEIFIDYYLAYTHTHEQKVVQGGNLCLL